MITEKYASQPLSLSTLSINRSAMGLVTELMEKGQQRLVRVEAGVLALQMLGFQMADGLEHVVGDDIEFVVDPRDAL